MPKNKKESIIFTLMMCFCMVFVMSVYNVCRNEGMMLLSIQHACMGFPIAFVVGLFCDVVIVSKIAKKIAFMIVNEDDKAIKKIIAISSCMVCGMVILMSLYGAIEVVGFHSSVFEVWMKNIPLNFIFALPLQLLIVGPFVRFIFNKSFA